MAARCPAAALREARNRATSSDPAGAATASGSTSSSVVSSTITKRRPGAPDHGRGSRTHSNTGQVVKTRIRPTGWRRKTAAARSRSRGRCRPAATPSATVLQSWPHALSCNPHAANHNRLRHSPPRSRPMPRFCANLSMMFTEHPFLDRFAAAAEAGFTAVEFLFPYDHPAAEIRTPAEGQRGSSRCCSTCPPAIGRWASAAPPAFPAARQSSGTASNARWTMPPCSATAACTAWPACCPPEPPTATAASIYAANLAWACEQATAAGILDRHRADQPPRHAGLLPQHHRPCRRDRGGDRPRPPRRSCSTSITAK